MDRPIAEVVEDIIRRNLRIAEFWKSAAGWAPIDAATLLSSARLDWQVSLSHTLKLWTAPQSRLGAAAADGLLILAWANLGALVEGTMKWFLSVYYITYRDAAVSLNNERPEPAAPDALAFDTLRRFFKASVWTKGLDYDEWIQHVQQRRNAIHAYRSRLLGDREEFHSDIRKYLEFLDELNGRVPYPDEELSY